MTVEWCLPHSATAILDSLQQMAERVYADLRSSFESHYAQARSRLVDGLDDILLSGLAKHDAGQYRARLALSVTTTHQSLFVFILGIEQLRCILDRLSIDQQHTKSPFDYLCHLLAEAPVDSFWNWGLLQPEEFTVLPLEKLESANTHTDHWRAQNIFFQSEGLAVREVCRTPEFSLQINAPPDLCDVVNPGVDSVSFELKVRFQTNARIFQKYGEAVQMSARNASRRSARRHDGIRLWEKVVVWLRTASP